MREAGLDGGANVARGVSGAGSVVDSDPVDSWLSAGRDSRAARRMAGAAGEWAVPGVERPGVVGETSVPARLSAAEAVARHPVISRWVRELREIASAPEDLGSVGLHEAFLALAGFADLLEAHTAPVAVAWKGRRDWESDGSKSANHALARDAHRSTTSCAALFRRAERLHSGMMPGTRKAWESGAISTETADLLKRAASGKRAELFLAEEADLLARIERTLHVDVVKEIRYWVDEADARVNPDGTPPGRERHLHASATFGGAVAIDGVLDPVGGAIVMKALRDIDAELKLADKRVRQARGRRAGGRRTPGEQAHQQ